MRPLTVLVAIASSLSLPLLGCAGTVSDDPDRGNETPRGGGPGGGGSLGGTGGRTGTGGAGGNEFGEGGAQGGAPNVGGATGQPQAPHEDLAAKTGFVCDPTKAPAGRPRLWLLSDKQYANTLATLFKNQRLQPGNGGLPTSFLNGVPLPFTFKNSADRFSTRALSYTLAEDELRDAMQAATTLAPRIVEDWAKRTCLKQATADAATCLGERVKFAAPILFGRPPTQEEETHFVQLGLSLSADLGLKGAAATVLRAMLMAPQFLYRTELGEPTGDGASRRLTNYEVASALAYGLTDAPPDRELWEAATAGALTDPAVIKGHVARLAAGLSKRGPVAAFFRQYYQYPQTSRIQRPDKGYNALMMIYDTDAFIGAMLDRHGENGFLSALLTSPLVFATKWTASLYGLTTTPAERIALETTPSPRFGILTQPSWLSSFAQVERTDPIRRGRFIRESMLCQHIPEVQIEDLPTIPEDPGRTQREKLEIHRSGVGCASCHALMDPLGLVFEGFGYIGENRAMEAGRPVDTTGELVGSADQDGPVSGPADLTARLAVSVTARECFVSHNFEYWMGRPASPGDECTLLAADTAFAQEQSYVKLLQALFSSDSFLLRRRWEESGENP